MAIIVCNILRLQQVREWPGKNLFKVWEFYFESGKTDLLKQSQEETFGVTLISTMF